MSGSPPAHRRHLNNSWPSPESLKKIDESKLVSAETPISWFHATNQYAQTKAQLLIHATKTKEGILACDNSSALSKLWTRDSACKCAGKYCDNQLESERLNIILHKKKVVHNCQHLCIGVGSTNGGGGRRPTYYFLNLVFVEHVININAGGTQQIVAQRLSVSRSHSKVDQGIVKLTAK